MVSGHFPSWECKAAHGAAPSRFYPPSPARSPGCRQEKRQAAALLSAPCRCESWSNSDRSLEQTSSDDVFVDSLQPQPSLYLVQPCGAVHQDAALLANPGAVPRSADVSGTPSDFSSSSPLLGTPLTPTFQTEQSQSALPYGVSQLDVLSNTPPPRPPKPTHFLDRRGDEASSRVLQNGHAGTCRAPVALVPRRISLSSLDNVRNWKGERVSELLALGGVGGCPLPALLLMLHGSPKMVRAGFGPVRAEFRPV